MVFMKILKNTIQIEKHKVLIVFDDMIPNALSNKKLQPVVTESLIRGRKLTFFLFLSYNLALLYQKTLD